MGLHPWFLQLFLWLVLFCCDGSSASPSTARTLPSTLTTNGAISIFPGTPSKCASFVGYVDLKYCYTPRQSCQNRCGTVAPVVEESRSLTGAMCACDSYCDFYEDCCWDFETQCPSIHNSASRMSYWETLRPKCLAGSFLALTGCEKDDFSDSSLHPVTSIPNSIVNDAAQADPEDRIVIDLDELNKTHDGSASSATGGTFGDPPMPLSRDGSFDTTFMNANLDQDESITYSPPGSLIDPHECTDRVLSTSVSNKCTALAKIKTFLHMAVDKKTGFLFMNERSYQCGEMPETNKQTVPIKLKLLSSPIEGLLEDKVDVRTISPFLPQHTLRRCLHNFMSRCSRCPIPGGDCHRSKHLTQDLYNETAREAKMQTFMKELQDADDTCHLSPPAAEVPENSPFSIVVASYADSSETAEPSYRLFSNIDDWAVRYCQSSDVKLDNCQTEMCGDRNILLGDGRCYRPSAIAFFVKSSSTKGLRPLEDLNNPQKLVRFVGMKQVPHLETAPSCLCAYLNQLYSVASLVNFLNPLNESVCEFKLLPVISRMSDVCLALNGSESDDARSKCQEIAQEIQQRKLLGLKPNESLSDQLDWKGSIEKMVRINAKKIITYDDKINSLLAAVKENPTPSAFTEKPSLLNHLIQDGGLEALTINPYCDAPKRVIFTCVQLESLNEPDHYQSDFSITQMVLSVFSKIRMAVNSHILCFRQHKDGSMQFVDDQFPHDSQDTKDDEKIDNNTEEEKEENDREDQNIGKPRGPDVGLSGVKNGDLTDTGTTGSQVSTQPTVTSVKREQQGDTTVEYRSNTINNLTQTGPKNSGMVTKIIKNWYHLFVLAPLFLKHI